MGPIVMDEPIYEQDRLPFEMREEMGRDFKIVKVPGTSFWLYR